jgi:hypothetical protein
MVESLIAILPGYVEPDVPFSVESLPLFLLPDTAEIVDDLKSVVLGQEHNSVTLNRM